MKSFFSKIWRTEDFSKHRNYWFLAGICTVFVLLRTPSVIEPHWYGDEGIYQVVGQALNEGRILYREIWDNKPPILYIIYAIVHADLFFVKLLSLISGFLSVIFFFFLALKIFKNRKAVIVATSLYAILFGAPVLEGNIANAENFMLLPIVAAGYFVYLYRHGRKTKQVIIAGLLLSVAFMTKTVAIFDFAAFFTFLFFTVSLKGKNLIKDYSYFIISFASLFLIFCSYFFLRGVFPDFVSGVFWQNVSYVSEQYGAANPYIILFVKTFLLLIFVAILVAMRKKMTNATLFIYLWIVFGIYNAFFSDRPYTHYLLVLLPAFSLLVGHIFEKTKTRIISIIGVIIVIFFAYYHFGIYRKNILYYQNYLQFITNGKIITDYQRFFDVNTPRDYKIANFITGNMEKNEPVLLLSDSAQIYSLSKKLPIGKYIVAYHITYYPRAERETKEEIEKERPRYIIQTSQGAIFKDLLSSYELKYIMDGAKIYERKI